MNEGVGADFVKTKTTSPRNFTLHSDGHTRFIASFLSLRFPYLGIGPHVRCATVDGDADRIIYFYHNEKGFSL